MTRQLSADWVLVSILIVGAALRFWGLTFGLPFPEARPDETSLIVTSLGLLFAGLNPHFFHWPSLMFYVVAGLYRIGWEIGHLRGLFELKFDMYKAAAVSAGPYLMVPRVLAAASGTATIWLTYRIVERLFDRLTALTAAFFVAVAFLHVRDSHFGVTDIPATAFAVGAMIPLVAVFEDPLRLRSWRLAGVLSGLAASTKYNGGLIVIAGVAVAVIHGWRRDASARRAAARGLALFLGAALFAFLCGTPFALLDASNFIEGLRFDANHLMEGHGIILGRGWWYHLTFSLWYGLGGPLLIAALAGMVVVATESWRKAVLLCSFPIAYYVLVGRGFTVFVRYVTPLVPFLCITAAILVVELSRRFVRPARVPKLVAVAAVLLAIPSLGRVAAFNTLIAKTDTRVLAAEWLGPRVQPQQWIYQSPPAVPFTDYGMTKRTDLATFDAGRNVFLSPDGAVVTPDWILLPESPLSVYTVIPPSLQAIAERDYAPATTIAATHGPEMPGWFDQQDLFFLPFTDFSQRDRPGPGIHILRRR